jgi:hypothetical protein
MRPNPYLIPVRPQGVTEKRVDMHTNVQIAQGTIPSSSVITNNSYLYSLGSSPICVHEVEKSLSFYPFGNVKTELIQGLKRSCLWHRQCLNILRCKTLDQWNHWPNTGLGMKDYGSVENRRSSFLREPPIWCFDKLLTLRKIFNSITLVYGAKDW